MVCVDENESHTKPASQIMVEGIFLPAAFFAPLAALYQPSFAALFAAGPV